MSVATARSLQTPRARAGTQRAVATGAKWAGPGTAAAFGCLRRSAGQSRADERGPVASHSPPASLEPSSLPPCVDGRVRLGRLFMLYAAHTPCGSKRHRLAGGITLRDRGRQLDRLGSCTLPTSPYLWHQKGQKVKQSGARRNTRHFTPCSRCLHYSTTGVYGPANSQHPTRTLPSLAAYLSSRLHAPCKDRCSGRRRRPRHGWPAVCPPSALYCTKQCSSVQRARGISSTLAPRLP